MTLIEFLLEMLDREMANATTQQKQADVRFKRKVVDLALNWPILLQTEPTLTHKVEKDSLSTVVFEMQAHYQFVLVNEYKRLFGEDPPTSPLLIEMAQIYSDHPNFNPEWKLKEN